jgi:tripartite-type tricarboxylate transporter receptor subunit TctC
VRERFERTGAFPMPKAPGEFAAFIREEADRWAPVLKETGIKFD